MNGASRTIAVVTGAKGFIGSNLARDLASQGYHVILGDLPDISDFRIKDLLINANQVNSLPLDLRGFDCIGWFIEKISQKVRDLDIARVEFYHPGAFFSYDPHSPYDRFHQINVEGTEMLIRALSESHIGHLTTVAVWSSATVHGGAENADGWMNKLGGCKMSPEAENLLRAPHLFFNETSPCLPSSRYELSKYVQEVVALRAGEKYGLDVRVGRPSGVYGPWSTYAAANAIFMIARGELKGIPGPGTARVCLVHVSDVVGAFQHIVRHGAPGEIYEIADDGKYTICELFARVASEINIWRKQRNEPPLQFDQNLHLPIPIIMATAWWLKLTSKITGLPAKIESDLVELFFRSARFSHDKLTTIGYQFKEPDTCEGIAKTVAWYAAQRWI